MLNPPSQTIKAHAAMLVFAFLISTSFTVGRAITFSLDPAPLTFLRFLMAVVVFSFVAIVSKEKFKFPSFTEWLKIFFLALLLVIFFITMFEGLRWTTPFAAGAVFTLIPFMTAIIAFIVFRERLGWIGVLGLLMAGLASIWIMFGGDINALTSLRLGQGEIIFLFGCIAYALYTPSVKRFHTGGRVYLTLWTLVAGCFLLLVYGSDQIVATKWHLASPLTYLAVAWLAVVTTAITFYLLHYATQRLPSVKVMSYTLLAPAFILLQRLLNGGSWPDVSVLAALALLLASMLVLQRA